MNMHACILYMYSHAWVYMCILCRWYMYNVFWFTVHIYNWNAPPPPPPSLAPNSSRS